MNDFDLDRLGDVWRQQPDPKEIEALKRTAAIVSRRARWAELFDLLAALVVSGVVITLVALNPRPDTVLIGITVILVLLGGHIRQRKLRAIEIKSLTGTVEEMLSQSIDRVEARQKSIRFAALVAAPGISLGLLFAYVVDRSSGGTLLPQIDEGSPLSVAINIIAGTALVLGAVHFLRSYRRNRKELERLLALREAYRQEQRPESPE
jgi:flagellar biosynthesis component FlhA